jgi:hypothetical protein
MTERMRTVGLATLGAAIGGAIFVFDPTRLGVFPPCPLHELTGLWCPGCGSTRALHQLVHGHLGLAFRLNPLAISLLPLVGYLAVRHERVAMKAVWIWTLLVTVVLFGILRNIPVYPLTLLAP